MKAHLLELLICPRCLPAEESLSVDILDERMGDIATGSLRCPQCGALYPIADGIALLDPQTTEAQRTANKYETDEVVSSYLWSHFSDLLRGGAGCVVDIHADDAARQGFAEGDLINISTPKGAIEMTARLSTSVRPGMVRLAWGWGDFDPRASLNILTEDDKRGPVSGTSTSRSFMCPLQKVSLASVGKSR